MIDPEILEWLQNAPTRKAYRTAQLIDGKPYPPMSAMVNGKLRDPIQLGEWEGAKENPEMADAKGYFTLDKGNGKKIKARYNPYIHSSDDMLNDQFSEAQDRDNLVTMEVEIPESELEDRPDAYRAEKAKDTVGTKKWKAGVIQGMLNGTRNVHLTRWDKPIRIVPDEEVAKNIYDKLNGKIKNMPSNVVPKNLRKELEKLGMEFVETDNKGYIKDGEHRGKHWSRIYGSKANQSELENFVDDLEEYKENHKKGRDDIPVATRR